MSTELSEIIPISKYARADVRRHLALGEADSLRVAFIPGPGDIEGTFEHWRAKKHEPRVPTISYSLMFYQLMEQLGSDSQIISIHPIGDTAQPPPEHFRFEHIVPIRSNGRWSYFWSQYRFAKAQIAMVERFDPHVVITSTHNPTSSWKRLSKGRKLILTAHNTFWPQGIPPRGLKGRLRKALLANRAASLDGAICTSHECARQVAELTGGRVRGEVHCPQIVARYPVERRTNVRNLLFLGRVEAPKGIFFLLDVFEQLADRYADIRLTIAGDGEATVELDKRLLRSRFSHRIDALGRIDSQGVHATIAASDLIVCPTMTSFNEGLAVVGFEGAAHGIPTLLSSVVPAADLLGDSCTVYEADNADSLRQALSYLIENPQAYRDRCLATSEVRHKIYDRSLSWGCGLFRELMKS